MPKRSRGEVDEFPQQLQDGFNCPTVNGAIGVTTSGAITEVEWDMPVELDLNHPIFVECSKIHCTQDLSLSPPAIATGVIGSPAFSVFREVKVMKEPRGGTWPTDNDRATLATFRMQSNWIATSAITCGLSFMETDKWMMYEDARTGLGELIAQPRLFVMTRTTVMAAGLVDPGSISGKELYLSLHYRLTDKVKGKEYLTELIAKFT